MLLEIFLAEPAQQQSLGLQDWSRGQRRKSHNRPRFKPRVTNVRPSLFAEGKTAETLVEARHLAARVEHLATSTGPGRVRARIDLEVQRVASLPQVERVWKVVPSVIWTVIV